jgi:hypothetical protein
MHCSLCSPQLCLHCWLSHLAPCSRRKYHWLLAFPMLKVVELAARCYGLGGMAGLAPTADCIPRMLGWADVLAASGPLLLVLGSGPHMPQARY